MQKHILLTVIALLVTASAAAQNQHSTDLEEKILDLEHRWIKAATDKNSKAVSQFLAENYVFVGPDGSVEGTNEYLAEVAKTTWQVNEISETRVIPHGDTVIVLGKWRGKGTDSSGQPIDAVQRYSDVWIKSPDGNWRASAVRNLGQIQTSQENRP
jgi:ketosteroid isomerase-like protein